MVARSEQLAAARPIPRRVLVLLLPSIHALDFAGPVQAIYEANGFGASYELRFVGAKTEVRSAQGFHLARIEPLPRITSDDWVVVPGIASSTLDRMVAPLDWLREAGTNAGRVSAICSGAFVLARAGLLAGKRCTTHWKLIERLAEWSPSSRVLENRLFVRDGNITTSAGESAGIDMTLATIQGDWGPALTTKVAREMVVYLRRSGDSGQESIYLQHRDHLHPGVHRVQDWIVEHSDERPTLDGLAEVAAISSRHLTRLFREATGVTLSAYTQRVKLEVARSLAADHALSLESIAARCGFADARQLRRLWRAHYGSSLGRERGRARTSS